MIERDFSGQNTTINLSTVIDTIKNVEEIHAKKTLNY